MQSYSQFLSKNLTERVHPLECDELARAEEGANRTFGYRQTVMHIEHITWSCIGCQDLVYVQL